MRSEPDVVMVPSMRVSCPMYVSMARPSAPLVVCLRPSISTSKVAAACERLRVCELVSRIARRQIGARVDGFAVDQHLIMHVRTRAQAGAAHRGDAVAALDYVADGDIQPRIVGVQRLQSVPVVDDDRQSVPAAVAGKYDGAGGRSVNRRTRGCGYIDASVQLHRPGNGMAS